MELKDEIRSTLKRIEELGSTRADIERELGYAQNFIDQMISKGGTQKALAALRLYENYLIAKGKVSSDLPEEIRELRELALESQHRLAEVLLQLAAIRKEMKDAANKSSGIGGTQKGGPDRGSSKGN